ncbi:MAG: sugar phosphorylase, partial [Candidatus Dormibacteraceae bacterium]
GRAAALLEGRLDHWRERHPSAGGRRRPDQSDVLLITYADTFEGAGPPLRTLHTFAREHLRDLVSGVHVLPFFPWSSDYGFAIKDYLKVDPRLGTWDDVDALAGEFDLMVDFVCNHLSAESGWFRSFLAGRLPERDYFLTADPRADLSAVVRPRTTPLLTEVATDAGPRWVWTTFSADQADLDYHHPSLLLRVLGVLLTYAEHGATRVRLDAVGYLWKELGTSCIHLPQTHELVKLFRDVLDLAAPGVSIVTETNVPHRDNVRYFGDGRDEAQMVYQFPLAPLVLDAFGRGDGGHLRDWARDLSTPSEETTFFNFLASHDGIGLVPARGLLSSEELGALADRVRRGGGQVSMKSEPDGGQSPYELNATFFDALGDPAEAWTLRRDRFLASQSIMLALAGVPGVYVHSLFGSHNFEADYRRSGWARDLNHGHLPLSQLEARLGDPGGETAQIFSGMQALLRARRGHPAFHPAAPQALPDAPPAVLCIRRGPARGRGVLCLVNLSDRRQPVDLASLTADARLGAPLFGNLRDSSLDPCATVWIDLSFDSGDQAVTPGGPNPGEVGANSVCNAQSGT